MYYCGMRFSCISRNPGRNPSHHASNRHPPSPAPRTPGTALVPRQQSLLGDVEDAEERRVLMQEEAYYNTITHYDGNTIKQYTYTLKSLIYLLRRLAKPPRIMYYWCIIGVLLG